MDELSYLFQKHPGLYKLTRNTNVIKVMKTLLERSKNFEEIKRDTLMERLTLEKVIRILLKVKLIDKLSVPNDILYYLTPIGKKFILAYLKEIGEID